jgi:hypothetical protein
MLPTAKLCNFEIFLIHQISGGSFILLFLFITFVLESLSLMAYALVFVSESSSSILQV